MVCILLLVVLHVALAPATVNLSHAVSEEATGRYRKWQIARFDDALRRQDGTCRDDLVPVVVAFRDYLKTKNIKLKIVLRPDPDALVEIDGRRLRHVTNSASSLVAAEKKLRKAGIRTINLVSSMHAAICNHPNEPACAPDGHFARFLIAQMAATIQGSVEERHLSRQGRNLLFVGDCYASLSAEVLQKGSELPSVRSRWKNASDNLMAYELSLLPDSMFVGIKEIYWFLSSTTVSANRKRSLPLPRSGSVNGEIGQEIRSALVQITQDTTAPSTLGSGSPYPNAYALHEATDAAGVRLLVIIQIMKDRQIIASQQWQKHMRLALTLQPWEQAVKEQPHLAQEQLLDDVQNYELPRFLVTHWVHSP